MKFEQIHLRMLRWVFSLFCFFVLGISIYVCSSELPCKWIKQGQPSKSMYIWSKSFHNLKEAGGTWKKKKKQMI